MFLRSQLVSRFPVSLLRLGCNSAPMTSSFSTTNAAVSRCNNHVIVSSTPQLARHFGASLVWIRGGGKDRKEEEEVKGARTEQSDGSSDNNEYDKLKKRLSYLGSLISLFVIPFACCMIGIIITESMSSEPIPADAPQVDLATFPEKYLKTGEVQKISVVHYTPFRTEFKLVAKLYDGAIIDGMQAKSRYVVIKSGSIDEVKKAVDFVREEESKMGIDHPVEKDCINPIFNKSGIPFKISLPIVTLIMTYNMAEYIRVFVKLRRLRIPLRK